MLNEGTRRFDLYDFFSVLIPGGAFVIGLTPFAPKTLPVTSTGGILMLIVASFVAGRGLHAIGLLIERPFDEDSEVDIKGIVGVVGGSIATSHREYFVSEVIEPDDLSEGLVEEFYSRTLEHFPELSFPDDRSNLNHEDHADDLETLYSLVRSFIHLDSRGRSRTFQAVLDFQRTTMVTAFMLYVPYGLYGLVKIFAQVPGDLVGYQSYIGSLDLTGWLVFYGATFLLIAADMTFLEIRSNYRYYFIQYLMADFINLHQADGGSDMAPPQ